MKTQERVFQAEGTASAKASRQRQCPNYLLTHRLLLNSRDQILLISTTSFLPCHRRWSVAWMEDQVKAACRPQMQADSDAVMRWERQLMVSFLFQLDPEGSQHHQLQRRDVPGRSPASSGPQILVSCPENEGPSVEYLCGSSEPPEGQNSRFKPPISSQKCPEAECFKLRCELGPLHRQESRSLQLHFRVWAKTFLQVREPHLSPDP